MITSSRGVVVNNPFLMNNKKESTTQSPASKTLINRGLSYEMCCPKNIKDINFVANAVDLENKDKLLTSLQNKF